VIRCFGDFEMKQEYIELSDLDLARMTDAQISAAAKQLAAEIDKQIAASFMNLPVRTDFRMPKNVIALEQRPWGALFPQTVGIIDGLQS
jgi:hypothetical protein